MVCVHQSLFEKSLLPKEWPSSKLLVWLVVSNIFYFHPDPWGNDPIWLIFFRWVVQPPTIGSSQKKNWTFCFMGSNGSVESALWNPEVISGMRWESPVRVGSKNDEDAMMGVVFLSKMPEGIDIYRWFGWNFCLKGDLGNSNGRRVIFVWKGSFEFPTCSAILKGGLSAISCWNI